MTVRRVKEGETIPKVKPVIGRLYHCSWAKNTRYVWRLVSFDETKDVANLITPKTKKPLTTKLTALRDVNKTKIKLKKERMIAHYKNNQFAPKTETNIGDENINLEIDPF